jgi:hypothetical protein
MVKRIVLTKIGTKLRCHGVKFKRRPTSGIIAMLIPNDRIARSMFSNGFLPGNRAAKRALPGTKSTKTKLTAERNKELLSAGIRIQTAVAVAIKRSSTKSKSGASDERNVNTLFFAE